jgi:hypothetical protein
MKTKILLLLTLGALLPTMGCVNVKPWERGALADSIMQADQDPIGEAQAEHVFFSREAATGGSSVGGGGCGCN